MNKAAIFRLLRYPHTVRVALAVTLQRFTTQPPLQSQSLLQVRKLNGVRYWPQIEFPHKYFDFFTDEVKSSSSFLHLQLPIQPTLISASLSVPAHLYRRRHPRPHAVLPQLQR